MSDILKEVKDIILMARARSKSGKSKTSTLDRIVEEIESLKAKLDSAEAVITQDCKEIQTLKEQIEFNSAAAGAAEALLKRDEKELKALKERMKHRDNYLDSRCDGCPDCGSMGCVHPDLLTKARVKVKALEKQLTDCDDALLKKGIFREEVHALHGTIKELKEQLARMGEALKKSNWMLDATPLDIRTVEDEELCFNENKKSLSSYDPKWIEGVRAEAKAEEYYRVIRAVVDELNYGDQDAFCSWLNLELNKAESRISGQPNQSQEKMG